jgi:hypothetical protein
VSEVRNVVHVGFNKAASTWLQVNVLPRLQDFSLVGCRATSDKTALDDAVIDAIRSLTSDDDGAGYEPGRLCSLLAPGSPDGRPFVLSEEGLVSTIRHDDVEVRRRSLIRLRSELGDVEVLLVTREPGALLVSTYQQYVRMGGVASFEAFERGAAPGWTMDRRKFDPWFLYSELAELFGGDRVHLLVAEHLRIDPNGARMRLQSLLGPYDDIAGAEGSRNESLSPRAVAGLRRLNRLFRRSPFNPRPVIRVRLLAAKGTSFVRWALIADRRVRWLRGGTAPTPSPAFRASFAPSNTQLQRLVTEDLAALGYPVVTS